MNPVRMLRYARRFRNWRALVGRRDGSRYVPEAILRDGTRFVGPPNVNPARAANGVYFKHCYTPAGLEIGPDDVVVDVGANIGVFSVYAAARTRGRVIAIEPFPENADYLERNLQANGCERVTVLRCAVSDRAGTARLHVSESGVLHRLAELGGGAGADAGHELEVPTATLEAIAAEQGLARIDFVKLDCEGAEGRILGGASPALLERIGRIALEFHDDVSPLDHDALRARLAQAGFQTRLRWDGRSATGFLYAFR